jgi:hypothetical protein
MQNFYMRTLAILLGSLASGAFAAPAGALLFSQEGAQIIDAAGVTRPARQGDALQTGERLLTPPNGISQVKLPDGSLISVRPGSELRIDPPPAGAPTQQQIALIHGAIRVIGAELMDKLKASAISLQTGQANLQLTGADIESAVVRADGQKPQGAGDPGSYNRLQTGAGTLRSGTVLEPLVLRQVNFVSLTSFQPITLASVSPTLFSSGALLATMPVGASVGGLAPASSTGLAPVTASVLSSSTLLSGKTLSPTTSTLASSSLSGPVSAAALLPAINVQNTFTPITTQSVLTVAGASPLQPQVIAAAPLPTTTVLTKVLFAPPVVIKPRVPICTFTLLYGTVCR